MLAFTAQTVPANSKTNRRPSVLMHGLRTDGRGRVQICVLSRNWFLRISNTESVRRHSICQNPDGQMRLLHIHSFQFGFAHLEISLSSTQHIPHIIYQ